MVSANPNPPVKVTRSEQFSWIAPLAVICLASFIYEFASRDGATDSLPYLAGHAVGGAVFIWLFFSLLAGAIWRDARTAPEWTRRKAIAFAVIFTSLFMGGLASGNNAKHQMSVAISSLQAEIAQFHASASDPAIPNIHVPRPPIVTKATGSAGKIETFLLELMAGFKSESDRYFADLEAAGWTTVLDPVRIASDTKLSEGRAIVSQAEAIVAKYESRITELLSNARQHIHLLPFPQEELRQMVAGFDKGLEKSHIAEQLQLERQAINHVRNMVELLATAEHGQDWTVRDGELTFMNEHDLATYNAHLEGILNVVNRQEQLAKDCLEQSTKSLEDAKRLVER